MLKDIRVTSNPTTMSDIGRQLYKKYRIVTRRQVETIMRTIVRFFPELTEEERESFFYRYYYDYMMYGFNIDQEFYFHLLSKTHEEKVTYITHASKFLYFLRLNRRGSMHLLEDKWEAYQLLKPYYGREMVKIESEADYDCFLSFISRHPVFVVKPLNLSNGLGIKKVISESYSDKKALFHELLGVGDDFIKAQDYSWNSNMRAAVLEELIIQDDSINKLNPSAVNGVRITTVRLGGDIIIYYPWIKVAVGGEFVACATLGGFDAGIDTKTGLIITDGVLETGETIQYHPDTNCKIFGFQIPHWSEAIALAKEVASYLDPSINYVGWDLVFTPKGWVIMEGNFYGDVMWQMCYGKGMRDDFEQLIGWKPSKKYWWQYSPDLEKPE